MSGEWVISNIIFESTTAPGLFNTFSIDTIQVQHIHIICTNVKCERRYIIYE